MGNSIYLSLPKSIMTRRRHPWFNNVFGFNEPKHYEDIYNYFHIETRDNDEVILNTIPQQNNDNGSNNNNNTSRRQFYVGKFNTPSIHELKNQLQQLQNVCDANNTTKQQQLLSFHHIIGDVGQLHVNNPNAVFQVASQFNCLEMPSPNVKPEHGITDYIYDGTQGPICALSCPAGTLYRNYFHNEYGQGGNNGGKQINTLKDIDKLLDNKTNKYWRMKNGYALPINNTTMGKLRTKLQSMNAEEINYLQDSLRVGVHWNTSVVNIENWTSIPNHNVTQVFASALPIGYDYNTPIDDWELFAQLILNSTYEATLAVAAIRQQQQQLHNNNNSNNKRIKVYLTMVGGGVFANKSIWIIKAIQRAIQIYKFYPLDIYLVHYKQYTKEYIETLPII